MCNDEYFCFAQDNQQSWLLFFPTLQPGQRLFVGGERGRGGDIAPACYCPLTPQVDII